MEEQPKTLERSPNPDNQHTHRVLLYAVGAIFLSLIVGGAGYMLGVNNTTSSQAQTQRATFSQTQVAQTQKTTSSQAQAAQAQGATYYISPTIAPVITPVTTTINWKTYTNEDAGITFQYPSTWSEQDAPTATPDFGGVTFTGAEGNINVQWGSGFGGGCEVQFHKTIQLKNETQDSCDLVQTDGTEVFSQIGHINSSTQGLNIRATVNSPMATNRDMILNVLKTVAFTKGQ